MGEQVPFGLWLKWSRKVLDVKQEELAELTGCSIHTIRGIEQGKTIPSKELAHALAEALAVDPSDYPAFIRYARTLNNVGEIAMNTETIEPTPWRTVQQATEGMKEETRPQRLTNLSQQLTRFIGREKEVDDIKKLLRRNDVRLLTLTGAGGTGKTRLSLQIGAELFDDFKDGVWFVELAHISNPELVSSAMAQVLGVKETVGHPVIDSLKSYLKDKRVLLVLDNFEQVAQAASLVDDLLKDTPELKVLVTSREALRLRSEREYAVPPLSLPDPGQLPPIEQLTQYEAVHLFIERAQAVKADFEVNEDNAAAIVEICVRLDGLPLAIELAAARIRLLPPRAMLLRLESRLALLTGGARDLPARQQTLRDAIYWSHDLLEAGEQQLFRRLAVFVGGGTLEAIEAICDAEGDLQVDVLGGVESLIRKSLLQQREGQDGELRFLMLETINEYAREKLEENGEGKSLRSKHAMYFLTMVEEAEPQLRGPQQAQWLVKLENDYANLRAALQWAQENGDINVIAHMSGALWRFWFARGYFSEGQSYLTAALASRGTLPASARAKVLYGSGRLAVMQDRYASARSLYEESLAIYRELGDEKGIANSLNDLGNVARCEGNYAEAAQLHEESLSIFRKLGDNRGIADALFQLANMTQEEGHHATARSLFEESLNILRQLGDKRGIAFSLFSMGDLARAQGDYESARAHYEESLTISQELGDKWSTANLLRSLGNASRYQGDELRAQSLLEESLAIFQQLEAKRGIADALANLGTLACDQGNYDQSRSLLMESLVKHKEIGNKQGIAECLEGLALVTVADADAVRRDTSGKIAALERAATLFGAAESLREVVGAPLDPVDLTQHNRALQSIKALADEANWTSAWAAGRSLDMEQAVAYALNTANKH